MTDTILLEDHITKSGKKKAYLAQKIGITRQALFKKINNESVFNAREITILSSELGITSTKEMQRIFFNA